jgi:hypothetical protein
MKTPTTTCTNIINPETGNNNQCRGVFNPSFQPYEYCLDCFMRIIDELKPHGPCHGQKYNGKIDHGLVAHIERVQFMGYGVQKWLYDKALKGCEDSLFKLEYSYRLFDEVQAKAKEEQKY